MSDFAFGLALVDARGNESKLEELQGAVRTLRRKAKNKSDARKYARMLHALKIVRVKVSQHV